MPRYEAQVLNVRTATVGLRLIEASDSNAALRAIELDADARVLRVNELRERFVARSKPSMLPTGEVTVFCSELQSLLGAGLSIIEALDALTSARKSTPRGRDLYLALIDNLREGKPLSGAMKALGVFPELLVASVRASERTSNLLESLESYLRYHELIDRLRRRAVSAALYPTIVAALGLAVAVFLLVVVIPRFSTLYDQLGNTAGGATHFMVALSQLIVAKPWAAPALLAGVGGGVAVCLRARGVRARVGRLARHVPWIRDGMENFERSRIYEALALLIKGGYPVVEALQICVTVARSPHQVTALEHVMRAVSRGGSIADAFSEAGLTDAVGARLLTAGDRGGRFDRVLTAIAQRHSKDFESFVERTSRLVEPILLLVVALLVGGMVVLLYMPVFDIASLIR